MTFRLMQAIPWPLRRLPTPLYGTAIVVRQYNHVHAFRYYPAGVTQDTFTYTITESGNGFKLHRSGHDSFAVINPSLLEKPVLSGRLFYFCANIICRVLRARKYSYADTV